MKKWIQKIVEQLEIEIPSHDRHPKDHGHSNEEIVINEERATLLFVLDSYSKNLIEMDMHPIRKVRELMDELSRELLAKDPQLVEKAMFKFRQFFSSYRLDEYTYIQNTFDDFRNIIWNFVDHLSEDLSDDRKEDIVMKHSLDKLKEAVESNSIDLVKMQSRQFIDFYLQVQNRKTSRRTRQVEKIKQNLNLVRQKLVDAHSSLRMDHLTKAYNRKTFDETIKQQWNLFQISKTPVSMIMLDIDFFKKINDRYGHAIGDFVLIECVKLLKEIFHRDVDSICRIGGEEFAIILPHHQEEHAEKKAQAALERIRNETFVHENMKLQFTVSMGIAQLQENEDPEVWAKRADHALYYSKNNGRNRYTLAPHQLIKDNVA